MGQVVKDIRFTLRMLRRSWGVSLEEREIKLLANQFAGFLPANYCGGGRNRSR